MNLHALLERWQAGEAVIPFEEGRPDSISRASWYRAAASSQIPGVLNLGRKKFLSLPIFLEYLGCPPDVIWRGRRE